ncbi:MAG TPA: hypothetical protein DEQ28_04730 [Clostridiales bacterium]|nr:hypothetical protein [Clostridiales bacterium]
MREIVGRKEVLLTVVLIVVVLPMATPAQASSMNYAVAWQTWSGAIWNGYVQIQASFNDNGRHARQGYHRFMREAGPALDTGRLWTSAATSPRDSTIRSRQDWVWDSPLWGDRYTTRYFWGFLWF